jgi:hypothetical protein
MQEVIHRCDAPRGLSGSTRRPCGERVPNNEPLSIVVNGTRYQADLCKEHQDQLLAAISLYVRPVRNDQGRAVYEGAGGHYATKDVRAWAIARGYEVAGSGRLPNELHEEYRRAHGLG